LVGRSTLSALDLVGNAAFLLTFGDVTGSEQPRQLIQLGIGTVLGATALRHWWDSWPALRSAFCFSCVNHLEARLPD
jgi:hypothetical protein